MTILIALTPGRRDIGALHLGAMLARSTAEDVTVVSVVPAPWPPDPYRADEEYLALQDGAAEVALAHARDHLGPGAFSVDTVLRRASSVAAGLLQVMSERAVSRVVVGSSSMGQLGRVMPGGVAERLLHSSEAPVAIAPRGFHVPRSTQVTRISVALGRADQSSGLLTRAAAAARQAGVPLRVVCFAVRPTATFTGSADHGAEQLVIKEWIGRLEHDVSARLANGEGPSQHDLATRVKVVVGQGNAWAEAIHDVTWEDGDVLAIGTSSTPLSRFFLGSHASKIVRNSPVPTVLLART